MDDEGISDESENLSNIIPFVDLAKMLERVSKSKKKPDKVRLIERYFETFRTRYKEFHKTLNPEDAHGDSIFSIVRLFCPTWDRERPSYGIKDVKMGQMFGKILGIDKSSVDGKKLWNYKDSAIVGSMAGDVGAVIYSVVSRRFTDRDKDDGPKILELHQVLDQLAKNGDGEREEDKVTLNKQIQILQGFVQRLGALEGKWLAKIILKKMDLGVHESTILGLIHPKAKELLDTMRLIDVCRVCNDPDVVDIPTGRVTLLGYFKPMLCHRLDVGNKKDEDSETSGKVIIGKSKRNPVTLPPAPFLVETKFDGERFQIHFKRGPPGGDAVFKFISRNGFEFKIFNETFAPRFKGLIHQSQSHPIESFIIDGEMMAYNYKNKNFTFKGQSMDVKTMRHHEDELHCPAFVAWDLVYFNGDSILHKPLTERMDLLKQVAQPKESVYYISEQKECGTLDEVMKLLDDVIERCEEGVVIKDRRSIYEPGQRKFSWLKLKPEYVDGYRVSDLDLLIVGGFYADKKNRGGKITSLLLGVLDDNNVVYPVTKVGCGRLKHSEMASLVESLKFVKEEIPGAVKFKGKKPDVFIDPKKSTVLQVNASELHPTKDYAINYCLRFPVVFRVRKDKAWDQAMKVSEFHNLRLSCKSGKMLRKREADGSVGIVGATKIKKGYFGQPVKFERDSDDETGNNHNQSHSKPKSTGKRTGTAANKAKPIPSPSKLLAVAKAINAESNRVLNSVQPESDIFQGNVFHVMGVSPTWKTETELFLKKHGAEIVKNPTRDTFGIVAEKETDLVKRKILTGQWDILNGTTWIDKCIHAKAIQPFVPQDLFYSTPETKESFAQDFDSYGDSYKEEISVSQLKQLLDKIIAEEGNEESERDFVKTKRRLYEDLCRQEKQLRNWAFFGKCKIAFFPVTDVSLKAIVEFYGGQVLEDWQTPDVTHIILLDGHEKDPERPTSSSIPIHLEEWIQACVKAKKLVY